LGVNVGTPAVIACGVLEHETNVRTMSAKHASTSAMTNSGVAVLSWISGFIWFLFFFLAGLILGLRGL